MKSRFRSSLAILAGAVAVMSSSVALAQTGPCNENDTTLGDCPTTPVGPGDGCSVALPSTSASGRGVGLLMTLAAAGLGTVLTRRKH